MYAIGGLLVSEAKGGRHGREIDMNLRILVAASLCATLWVAPGALADDPYTDEDSDYLKVASFFIEPVGRVLEWVVFRPIHAIHHLIDPSDRVEGGPDRVCGGLRPRRECTSAKY